MDRDEPGLIMGGLLLVLVVEEGDDGIVFFCFLWLDWVDTSTSWRDAVLLLVVVLLIVLLLLLLLFWGEEEEEDALLFKRFDLLVVTAVVADVGRSVVLIAGSGHAVLVKEE